MHCIMRAWRIAYCIGVFPLKMTARRIGFLGFQTMKSLCSFLLVECRLMSLMSPVLRDVLLTTFSHGIQILFD